MNTISFDRIPGLMDLLARMERFTLDSPAREYLAICGDIGKVWETMHEMLDPLGERAADAMIQRIYGTLAYRSYRDECKVLFAQPFFDGIRYVEESRRCEQARERALQEGRRFVPAPNWEAFLEHVTASAGRR